MKYREELAALCHEQWSGWMKYLIGRCRESGVNDGVFSGLVIPEWAVERWTRQMNTPYAELSEAEKDSDRAEADKFLAIIAKQENQ